MSLMKLNFTYMHRLIHRCWITFDFYDFPKNYYKLGYLFKLLVKILGSY